MFESEELNEHLKSSHTLEQESLILAEWNLNESDNVKIIGNYRYRPSDPASTYYKISPIFDSVDARNDYTGATQADIALDGGLSDDDNPIFFVSSNKKMEMLYSLEDCFKPFRPRSGICKLLYLSNISASLRKSTQSNDDTVYQSNQYIDDLTISVARRPRYYMSSRYDQFKYWTSYRTEVEEVLGIPERPAKKITKEFGVSENDTAGNHFISDAAPFVVYKNAIPANRLVVKMQTNVGEENLGPYRIGLQENVLDPLYGQERQTTPKKWKVQVLKNNDWLDAISFGPDSVREDGSTIIKSDGYLEVAYGLNVPERYKNTFIYAGTLSSTQSLPDSAPLGYAYLIRANEGEVGTFYIQDGSNSIIDLPGWASFDPTYSWTVHEENITRSTKIIKGLVDPESYRIGNVVYYREFDLIEGIRIVAEQMNVPNAPFDLIEMSPRLVADISEMTESFSITKTLSDLGNSSVPVGSLYPSTGSISIFDDKFVFNENNIFNPITQKGSLVAQRRSTKIKFNFYEITKNVNGFDYFIPVKVLYSEGIPKVSDASIKIQIDLRDFYFYLESEKSPEILLTNVSLSYAITALLDNIGFSNYVFKRAEGEKDFVIPFFFTGAEQNVAQVLQDLAISTQSAMYFDEYNNFVVMSKDYLLPSDDKRNAEIKFYGHIDEWQIDAGKAEIKNGIVTIITNEPNYLSVGDTVVVSGFDIPINGTWKTTSVIDNTISYLVENQEDAVSTNTGMLSSKNLPNIINIASEDKKVYNNGQINYTTRYIQRSIGKYGQAAYNTEAQNYVYKPVLLWEVAGIENVTSVNELPSKSSGYYLAAAPIRSSLTSEIPYVLDNEIFNNKIDLGNNVYWLGGKYSGYLNSNGEIIKYDAIEYSVQGVGNVWISSAQEYQDYFGRLQFNGKMFPTGNVRIYADPEYSTLSNITQMNNGPVKKHGRGQFGTKVVYHSAGLTEDSYWTNNLFVKGIVQDAKKYLFSMNSYIEYPANLSTGVAGKTRTTSLVTVDADEYSQNSTRNGIIKDFLSNKNLTEKEVSYYKTANSGSIQTSALVFNGPEIPEQLDGSDFVSYVYKDLSSAFPSQVDVVQEVGQIERDANTAFTHFGTRMRIIGKIESATNNSQTPAGAYEIFNNNNASSNSPSDSITVSGGSGGIAFNLNKDTNNGYFFEIVALTTDQVNSYTSNGNVVSFDIIKTYTRQGVDENQQTIQLEVSGVSVIDDLMTVITEKQHNFIVSDKVLVSGLTDKNNPQNSLTTLNGEHEIISISDDRKSFVARIRAPETTTAGIMSAQGFGNYSRYRTVNKVFSAGQFVEISGCPNVLFNTEVDKPVYITGTSSDGVVYVVSSGVRVTDLQGQRYVTYTTSSPHEIYAGQKVDISGMAPESFNLKEVQVHSSDLLNNTFTVKVGQDFNDLSSTKSGKVYGILETFTTNLATSERSLAGGTATYVPLTTESNSGGKAQKEIDQQLNLSNVLFYKNMAGSSVATVIAKEKDAKTGFVANQATLTTLLPHPFVVGDEIQVQINDENFDGPSFIVNSITEYTFTYTTENFSVIPKVELSTAGTAIGREKRAIPQLLWSGFAEINLDDGLFSTETRFTNSEQTTIYDLSAEYVRVDESLRFYLFLNGKQIATVDDENPLPIYNNMALFVRGSSKVMFENVYAIGVNASNKWIYPEATPIIQSGFGNLNLQKTSDVVRRYGMSDVIKNTYCSGISSQLPPKYNMYFEEFGTIMREVAYFNIKYDRAFPALIAKIAPTINDIKAYNISGFYAGSYRAEFLVFNNMDKTINLDDTTGNYLRIFGISFTQNTTRSLRVDEFLEKIGNLSDPNIEDGTILYNPFLYREIYDQVKQSRLKYGNIEFSLDSPFIQNSDTAEQILDWVIKKTYTPKKAIGMSVFGASNLQLGDIISINYKNTSGIYVLGDPSVRYVVYNIEYSKSGPDRQMTIYAVEV